VGAGHQLHIRIMGRRCMDPDPDAKLFLRNKIGIGRAGPWQLCRSRTAGANGSMSMPGFGCKASTRLQTAWPGAVGTVYYTMEMQDWGVWGGIFNLGASNAGRFCTNCGYNGGFLGKTGCGILGSGARVGLDVCGAQPRTWQFRTRGTAVFQADGLHVAVSAGAELWGCGESLPRMADPRLLGDRACPTDRIGRRGGDPHPRSIHPRLGVLRPHKKIPHRHSPTEE
jgi:hypothetical protein